MLGGVNIRGFAGHEVKEAVELDVATGVGVDDGEDALEVDLALLVLANAVAKRYSAVLELLGIQTTGPENTAVIVKTHYIFNQTVKIYRL